MYRLFGVLLGVAMTMAALPAAAAPAREDGRSAASAPRSVRIAAAGDIACEPPYSTSPVTCRHAATARLIRRQGVRAVLALGDTQYETGALSDYRQSYDRTWGSLLAKTRPAIGNHEYGTTGAAGYYRYFGRRAHRRSDGHYAYDLGRWRLYSLNTNCDRVNCAAQARWLRRDLAAHPRRCSLAAMHHPRFSSGLHGDSSIWAGQFWPALDRHQVDVALAGHDHDYERFAPMSASGARSERGIRSWVVGTGGKGLRGFTGRHPGSRVRSNDRAGVLFLTLRPGEYTWRFRTVDGRVRDSGTGRCVR